MINISHYKKTQHSIAIIVCIISMFYAAQWLWKTLTPNNIANTTASSAVVKSKNAIKHHSSKQTNNDIRDILSANIFKQKTKNKVTTEIIQTNIPKTKQALFLKGLIHSSDAQNSMALIATTKSGAPLPYKLKDSLPNNSGILHLILDKTIQIKRNGRLEKVTLIKSKNSKPLQKNAFQRKKKNPFLSLNNLKTQYKSNSNKLLSKFGLQKTAKGIQLSSKKGRLPKGLRENDVITSLNGYSLNDIENDPTLVDQFIESGDIEASLERNGRTIFFKIPQKLLSTWKTSR